MVCVIRSPQVVTLQHAGKRIVRQLFDVFSGSTAKSLDRTLQRFYPTDWQDGCDRAITTCLEAENRNVIRSFARDYVASMTDAQAEATWRRLFLPAGGSIFTATL
jgi:dGTP triphosphohydrolase